MTTAVRRSRPVRLPKHSARLHLLLTPLARTADPVRAEASPWPWNVTREPLDGDGPIRYATVYELRLLGVLHRLCGLTVEVTQ